MLPPGFPFLCPSRSFSQFHAPIFFAFPSARLPARVRSEQTAFLPLFPPPRFFLYSAAIRWLHTFFSLCLLFSVPPFLILRLAVSPDQVQCDHPRSSLLPLPYQAQRPSFCLHPLFFQIRIVSLCLFHVLATSFSMRLSHLKPVYF